MDYSEVGLQNSRVPERRKQQQTKFLSMLDRALIILQEILTTDFWASVYYHSSNTPMEIKYYCWEIILFLFEEY